MPRTLQPDEIPRLSREEFRNAEKLPLVIVLDNIRSQHNIGSVFRTADAFRIEAVYLCGITACPPSPEIHKSALGATETVAWKYFSRTEEAIDKLRSAGYRIAALERAEGSFAIGNLDIRNEESWAIILGNEVKGIGDSIMSLVDICVEIPQSGTKHSLNVSIAGGIVQWEFYKAYHAISDLTFGQD